MRSNKGLSLGILLVAAGIIWILGIYHIVNTSTIAAALKLWPLILVAIGISFIFRNNGFIKTTAWLALLAVIVGYGYFAKPSWNWDFSVRTETDDRQEKTASKAASKAAEASPTPSIKPAGTDTGRSKAVEVSDSKENIAIVKKPGTEKAELKLGLEATAISVDSDIDGDNLVEAGVSSNMTKFIDYSVSPLDNNRQTEVEFSMKKFDIADIGDVNKLSAGFHLNRDVAWSLNLNTGAVSSDLDLSGLNVEKLDINTGASSFNIKMGSCNTKVKIGAGASTFKIILPENTGIKFSLDGALNSTNFDEEGWIKKAGDYYSPDYDSKAFKIDAEVKMGMGKLIVDAG